MIAGTVAVGFVHPNEWSNCFGLSFDDLRCYDIGHHQRLVHPEAGSGRIVQFCPTGDLVASRNNIVRTFLDRTQREWLWFVDTDMGFAPDTIDNLVDAADPTDRPVVGGLCFGLKKQGDGDHYSLVADMFPTLYDMYEDDTTAGFVNRVDYQPGEITQVAATGAACLLIHRTVLEKIRAAEGDHWFEKIQHPKQSEAFSEDLSFCIRCALVDAPVFVHAGVTTNHDKGGLQLNEVTFDRQMRAVKAEAAQFFASMAGLWLSCFAPAPRPIRSGTWPTKRGRRVKVA